jgi:indole-3-glycerol phosphate synthase
MPQATLDSILAATRRRVADLRPQAVELERRAGAALPAPPFAAALAGTTLGVIAEVKRRSPSAGPIALELDPVRHAAAYERGGAVAISVLTEPPHFGGSLADLEQVARAVRVPVLRKDFVVDELQLLESRGAGASAVLLIVRALPGPELGRLARAARGLGLGVLVEAHTESELDRALAAEPTALGINSRDLATFTLDLAAAERLVGRVPPEVPVVAESGIEDRAAVERFARAGADLVLVGTAAARAADPAATVRALCGVGRQRRRSAGEGVAR